MLSTKTIEMVLFTVLTVHTVILSFGLVVAVFTTAYLPALFLALGLMATIAAFFYVIEEAYLWSLLCIILSYVGTVGLTLTVSRL